MYMGWLIGRSLLQARNGIHIRMLSNSTPKNIVNNMSNILLISRIMINITLIQ